MPNLPLLKPAAKGSLPAIVGTVPARRVLTARITPDEHARVLAAAEAAGVSVEDLIRARLGDVLAPPAPKA